MGKIIVSDNVSLDGVIQDPAGDEGFARGGWVGLIQDRPQLGEIALDEALSTEAMLMGRRTYEWFAAKWPSRSGKLADRLNSKPKYVMSSTLEHADYHIAPDRRLHQKSKMVASPGPPVSSWFRERETRL